MFDPERALRDVEQLSFPRRCGGPGEARATEFVMGRLREAGLSPTLESFSFSLLLLDVVAPLILLACAGVVAAATLLFPRAPAAALAVLLAGFVATLPATRWSPRLERVLGFRARLRSANVVARLPAPAEARRHLVLMAHRDSKSQRLPIWLRIAAAVGVLAGGGLLLAAVVAGLVFGATAWLEALARGAGGITVLGLVALLLNRSGDRSPGALDNATGVAALLELARILVEHPPAHTRVTVVCTGAEEEGLAGAVRFFEEHAAELGVGGPGEATSSFLPPRGVGRRATVAAENWALPRPDHLGTCLLNLDTVGGAESVAILSHFGVPPVSTGRALAAKAQEVADREGIPARCLYMPAGAGTDHFPAAIRGIPAITLSSFGPCLRRIHTPADTPALVSPEALGHAGRLALALGRELDDEQGPA